MVFPRPESRARISERSPEFNGGWQARRGSIYRQKWRFCIVLAVRHRGNPGAVPAPHQHAILGPAQVRDTHREPNPDRRQRDRERQCSNIGQHAMPEIVRLITGPLIAGQVPGRRPAVGVSLVDRFIAVARLVPMPGLVPMPRRMSRSPRPEFDHDVLVVPW